MKPAPYRHTSLDEEMDEYPSEGPLSSHMGPHLEKLMNALQEASRHLIQASDAAEDLRRDLRMQFHIRSRGLHSDANKTCQFVEMAKATLARSTAAAYAQLEAIAQYRD